MRRGEQVATFAWNDARHLELYFAVPCMGAVLHPLNLRLGGEDIAFIANHAEDEVLFVDPSLLPRGGEARSPPEVACGNTW